MATGLNLGATATLNLVQEGYLAKSDAQDASDIQHPILELFERSSTLDAEGKWTVVPIQTGKPQANAAAGGFNTAWTKSLSQNVKSQKFIIKPKMHYGMAALDLEMVLALNPSSKNYIGTLSDYALEAEQNLKHQLAYLLCRGQGDGFIGKVAALGTNTIDFENPNDALAVEEGMGIVAASTLTATIRTVGSTGLIAAGQGNPANGRVTFTGVVATEASGISVGDFLFYDWARTPASPATTKVMNGFAGWIPSADPSASESFNGVDRSSNFRLYGRRVGARGKKYRDALTVALSQNEQFGGKNNGKRVLLCSPTMKGNFMSELYGQTTESTQEGAQLVFNSVRVNDGVDIITDSAMPLDTAYLMQTDTWGLRHRGNRLVNTQDPITGDMFRARDGFDDYIAVAYSCVDLECHNPAANVRIDFNIDPTF